MSPLLRRPDEEQPLLFEGITCWKVATASRATLLIDAEEYFSALRAAMLKARRQILIAGWDFDTRIVLPRCAADGTGESLAAPTRLGELLGYLIRTRPGLEVHVLRWDHYAIYGRDREHDTRRKLASIGVYFREDDTHAFTGCVHHKLVVIDDVLAFCGGIDLTHQRWDSCRHEPQDERRQDHAGRCYAPTHDAELCVAGPAARLLGQYMRNCWSLSAGYCPDSVYGVPELWPDPLRVDFHDVRCGVSRTLPARAGRASVREIERLYLTAIATTRHELYIENQYFTSTRIAQAIAAQCRREPQLEGLLVGCQRPRTWIEDHTMGYGRVRFHEWLAMSGALGRVPLVAALDSAAQRIIVHSKLAIFDDRLLTVGSANLNQRSMGFDVECNLALEAQTDSERQQLKRLRNRLLGEHLELDPAEVGPAIQMHGLARLPQIVCRRRRLVPVDLTRTRHNLGPMLAPLFDREQLWPVPVSRAAALVRKWQHAVVLFGLVCYLRFTGRVRAPHEMAPHEIA